MCNHISKIKMYIFQGVILLFCKCFFYCNEVGCEQYQYTIGPCTGLVVPVILLPWRLSRLPGSVVLRGDAPCPCSAAQDRPCDRCNVTAVRDAQKYSTLPSWRVAREELAACIQVHQHAAPPAVHAPGYGGGALHCGVRTAVPAAHAVGMDDAWCFGPG